MVSTGQWGGAITFHPRAVRRAPAVVRWLQEQPWVGAVLARDGGPRRRAPGDAAPSPWPGTAWWGRGPPDLRFGGAWSDAPDETGIPGSIAGGPRPGAAQGGGEGRWPRHGSAQPLRPAQQPLRLGAPLQARLRSEVPAGIVDVAPTVRHLLGLPAGPGDGRVLHEALAGGPAPARLEVTRSVHEGAVRWPVGASGSACAALRWRAPATWRG